jgi:hypothetical protein
VTVATQTPFYACWAPDPWDSSRLRYWDGKRWTEHTAEGHGDPVPIWPGWYADPDRPRQQRFWSGTAWGDTRTKVPEVVWILLLGFLTLQGCGTSLTQSPTCHPGGNAAGVSTPASTPFAATLAMWLAGVVVAFVVAVYWTRRRWFPVWGAWGLVAGALFFPFLSWFFAAASCGL